LEEPNSSAGQISFLTGGSIMVSPNAAIVSYRADILAQVALTRRPDVCLSKFDIGRLRNDSTPEVEFIGTINPDDGEHTAGVFAVAVWGTDKEIKGEATATRWMDHRWKQITHTGTFAVCHIPTIAMLFSMVGDMGYYAWILEPILDPDTKAPQLAGTEWGRLTSHLMDKRALDEIVDKIKEWYGHQPVVSRISHNGSMARS
jgi:hypothetical protein